MKFDICPQWDKFGEKCSSWKKVIIFLWVKFSEKSPLQDFPSPKVLKFFDILKEAFQPDLSESPLFFF